MYQLSYDPHNTNSIQLCAHWFGENTSTIDTPNTFTNGVSLVFCFKYHMYIHECCYYNDIIFIQDSYICIGKPDESIISPPPVPHEKSHISMTYTKLLRLPNKIDFRHYIKYSPPLKAIIH